MSPPITKMISNQPKQVELTLDLEPYIQAYETRAEDTGCKYTALRKTLSDAVQGLTGDCIWMDALDEATQALDALEADVIKLSLACTILGRHFVEIIKNVMDEAILGYYDAKRPPQITLTVDIDTDSKPGFAVIKLIDSGRGFPDDLLESVKTPINRDKYLQMKLGFFKHAVNSNSSLESMNAPENNKRARDELPELFGGKKRGLRNFISDVDERNSKKVGKRRERYEASEYASLVFDNQSNDAGEAMGAVITLTTSIAPQENTKKQRVGKNSPLSVTTRFDEDCSTTDDRKVTSCCSCFG